VLDVHTVLLTVGAGPRGLAGPLILGPSFRARQVLGPLVGRERGGVGLTPPRPAWAHWESRRSSSSRRARAQACPSSTSSSARSGPASSLLCTSQLSFMSSRNAAEKSVRLYPQRHLKQS